MSPQMLIDLLVPHMRRLFQAIKAFLQQADLVWVFSQNETLRLSDVDLLNETHM